MARQKLKTDQSRFDGVFRVVGAVAMVAGVFIEGDTPQINAVGAPGQRDVGGLPASC